MSSRINRFFEKVESSLDSGVHNAVSTRDIVSSKLNSFFERLEGSLSAREPALLDTGRHMMWWLIVAILICVVVATCSVKPETPEELEVRMMKLRERAEARRSQLMREFELEAK